MREEVELQEWQIEKIQRGIRQADAGEFATDEEVAKVFERFIEEEGVEPEDWEPGVEIPG
jgi:predicted transcriptional regulator